MNKPGRRCPVCSAVADGCTTVGGEQIPPNPGDFSMCLSCGAVCVFTEDLEFRLPTGVEAAEILTTPEIVKTMAIGAMLRGLRQVRARAN